jgi:hypothetical protein
VVTEVSRVEAIDCAAGWSVVPVISDGLVLLTGGAGSAIRDAADDVPVLQAIGPEGERFRITWPVSGREIEPGAVTIAPGGDIVFPLYEHDTSLQVLRVSRDGSVVARDELRDAEPYDVVAFDLYSKLRVAVTPLSDQALSHAARIADNGLTAVAATVEGRRAYLRDQASLRVIEW